MPLSGIGTPIAERPSHTIRLRINAMAGQAGRTGRVSGGPRFAKASTGQVGFGQGRPR